MEEEKEQDLAHIHWQFPEAIAANSARSLANADLAMDYFAFSPFWDQRSNNNQLRTQNRVENPAYGSAEEKLQLPEFSTGFEYVVAHARPPDMFVIHRRPVTAKGARGAPTHAYFILHERIYMSPNLHTIVRTRVANANSLLERTLGLLEAARPPANPRAASVWIAGESKKDKKEEKKEEGEKAEEDVEMKEEKEEEKREEKKDEKRRGDDAPDWHLFNAMAATRAALPGLNTLAASARPAHDDAAEAKTLEALAAASVRPNNPAPQAQGAAATPIGTPLAGFSALSPLQSQTQGTPGPGFTPRPRLGSISLMGGMSRAGSTFAPSLPADSPKM